MGRSWATARLTLGLVMAHRMAHSWAYLDPLLGSLLVIGREDGRYSRARGRRRTHVGADTGRSETDAASQHIIQPSHMTSLIISSSYRRLCAVCALGVQSKCTRFQAKNTHKWQEFSLCALCAVFSYKTYIYNIFMFYIGFIYVYIYKKCQKKKCTHCTSAVFRIKSLINEKKHVCKTFAHVCTRVHT